MTELAQTLQALGGLGLFLLGMIIMTDGLRALAGDAIRRALFRFTRSPLSGVVTGTVSTAILQSSSATTVAAVGFVAAGLMTFPEALGIIFGANIGTTFTGWLVALLGFKLKLGSLVMPVVFLGALLKLFSRGRIAASGLALAGFGLIFVGITNLQEGMVTLQGSILLAQLPSDSLLGRLSMVLLGIVFTLVTQSSSAGVAAALTALFTGLVNFEQAAAMVIGMNVGTTVTAAVATLGGSIGSRRTGYSHVIYNLLISIGAFLLINPYTWLWEALAPGQLIANAEIALVAFHTCFNALGVIVILPFTYRFAHLVERIVPGSDDSYIERLDKSLLGTPAVALTTLEKVVHDELLVLLNHVRWLVTYGQQGQAARLMPLQRAFDESLLYLEHIQLKSDDTEARPQLLATYHVLDHMQRLYKRCAKEESRVFTARETAGLMDKCALMSDCISQILHGMEEYHFDTAMQCTATLQQRMQEERPPYRASIMEQIASGELSVPEGTRRLEAIRWLDRVSHHLDRIMQHLGTAQAKHHEKAD
jgi:phosphate:Na+ symporter